MTITQHVINDVSVLTPSGDLTVAAPGRPGLTDMVLDTLAQGRRSFLLDMAGVRRMDSAGLGDVLQAFVLIRRRGGDLALLHLRPRLRARFLVTRVLTPLDLFGDEAAALKSLEGRAAARAHSHRER